jgi:predicted DNA-binding protein with PD1-like motif
MKVKKDKDGLLIRMDRGDKIHSNLIELAEEYNFPSASYVGIGAVENCEIGYYDLAAEGYLKKTFKGEMELLNITGNISWKDDKAFPHSHVTLADKNYQALGGHLFEAEVAVTMELHLQPRETKVIRTPDEKVCLHTWHLD